MADLELSDVERRALGEGALAWVLQYFATATESPVYPAVSATELSDMVREPLPRMAQDVTSVLAQFARVADLGRKNAHPRMFGYVQSSGNFAGTIGDFLASALNQNVTSWRSAPAATAVELQVIDWIKRFVGCESFGGGVLLGGGSAANLAGLAAALRASTDVDVHAQGVRALPGAPVIYASDRVHLSVPKAAALLGLGRQAVHLVASGSDGRLKVDALRAQVVADRADGKHLVAVVANAGEVNTGAVDALHEVAHVCEQERLWLHVDGAYGGFAAAVPALAGVFAGLSRADSLSLDPHKWLFAPLDVGCLLVRDGDTLRRVFAQSAAYIDVVVERDMSDFAFWDVSPELSRRFRALKLWFSFKCHGAEAFTATIAQNVDRARELAEAIDNADDFQRLAPAPLSIVCFRYVPAAFADDEAALNDLNRRLLVDIQRDGDSYVSNALIGGRFALRACIVNHRTTADDMTQLLATIRRLGSAIVGGRRR